MRNSKLTLSTKLSTAMFLLFVGFGFNSAQASEALNVNTSNTTTEMTQGSENSISKKGKKNKKKRRRSNGHRCEGLGG